MDADPLPSPVTTKAASFSSQSRRRRKTSWVSVGDASVRVDGSVWVCDTAGNSRDVGVDWLLCHSHVRAVCGSRVALCV